MLLSSRSGSVEPSRFSAFGQTGRQRRFERARSRWALRFGALLITNVEGRPSLSIVANVPTGMAATARPADEVAAPSHVRVRRSRRTVSHDTGFVELGGSSSIRHTGGGV